MMGSRIKENRFMNVFSLVLDSIILILNYWYI